MTSSIPGVIYINVAGSVEDADFAALYPESTSSLIKVDINDL